MPQPQPLQQQHKGRPTGDRESEAALVTTTENSTKRISSSGEKQESKSLGTVATAEGEMDTM